jgi:hypothetical protein
MVPQNCHPDRSVAQWRDLLFLFRFSRRLFSPDIILKTHDTGGRALGSVPRLRRSDHLRD